MADQPKKINLALQGGGAHGAYSWGVLDRLLQDDRLEIEAISGTSAGAMNAAVLASGYVKGGAEGAREALHDFWHDVSSLSILAPFQNNPYAQMFMGWNLDQSPVYFYYDVLSRMFSPYDLNPLNINPLRDILTRHLDTDQLHHCSKIKLFLTATEVETGQPHVFECPNITVDAVCASACIPFLFQAMEIEGRHYWDGGYVGNPALWPLIYHSSCVDVMLVQINPLVRDEIPHHATDIINRLNEITFNSSLIAEMRAINFVKKLVKDGTLTQDRYKNMHMHLIHSPKELCDLNASSKLNAGWDFFQYLFEKGFSAADQWLGQHYHSIGVESTVDIERQFLGGSKLHRNQSKNEHRPKQEKQKKAG